MACTIIDAKEMDSKDDEEIRKPEWETTQPPAGAEWWKGTSQSMNGDALGAVSAYDTSASKFSQFVKVEHDKAFTLKPLILTSGPLKGSHVLMLEATSSPVTSPSSPRFRFMELAAELRCKVYEHLLEEDKPIKIAVYMRRPVREGHGYERKDKSKGLVWHVRSGKWIDQSPSNLAILHVSKQVHKEAVPIAYGGNTFSFEHPHGFKAFARGIGRMCKYVKQIEFPKWITWSRGGRTNPFLLLGELTNLHTVKISEDALNRHYGSKGPGSVLNFVAEVTESLEKLKSIHDANESEVSVLDIFQITASSRCPACRGEYETRPRYGIPPWCTCHELEPHRGKVETLLRSSLAKALNIEDRTGKR